MAWGSDDSGDDWMCDNLDTQPTRLGCGGKTKARNQAKSLGWVRVLVTKRGKISTPYFNHSNSTFTSILGFYV